MTTDNRTAELRAVGGGDHVVICLHGWFGSAQGWGALPDLVDTRTFTWVFPDARGYGVRRAEPGAFTMEEVAEDGVALADGLGVDRFSVLGHSMGAKAASWLQHLAPDRVRSLVGVNPVPPVPTPLDAQGDALFFGAADDPAKRRAIIDLTTGGRHRDFWLEQMVEHSTGTSDREAFAGYAESWVRGDFHDQLDSPEVPVLVVVGATDPALSADVMEQTWLQWYPQASLVTLPEAGHYPMFEAPLALLDVVEPFLRDH
ncbi:MAG TPA: alpha/beta hydrolase [Nocardioidaceae bacterium]|nr:alpha/beta hydrolase [Nocardioidaceae bacterium]